MTFGVQNQGTQRIEACVGEERSVHSGTKGVLQIVDHPYCLKLFSLEPQAYVEWTEEIGVPDVAPGQIHLSIEVAIVDPNACERYGCYRMTLRTGAQTEARAPTSPKRIVSLKS